MRTLTMKELNDNGFTFNTDMPYQAALDALPANEAVRCVELFGFDDYDIALTGYVATHVVTAGNLMVRAYLKTEGRIFAAGDIVAYGRLESGATIEVGKDVTAGGTIRAKERLVVGGTVEAGLNITAGHDIAVGGSLNAGANVKARGIMVSGDLKAEGKTTSEGHIAVEGTLTSNQRIEAGLFIHVGRDVLSLESIRSGRRIVAGGIIEAGENYGIYAGTNLKLDDPRAYIKASVEPDNIQCGKYMDKVEK